MDERIADILNNYRDTVKPLLADIQARRSDDKLPDNFLNEIRALNDHIARCYRNDASDKFIDSELTKAEGHLRRLIYDCFKQLNIYISDTLEYKERKYYSEMWLTHKNGAFWISYSKYRKYAQQFVIDAKKSESTDSDRAMALYEKAFQSYRRAEELLLDNKTMLKLSFVNKHLLKADHLGWWFFITVILSVISAIIGLLC